MNILKFLKFKRKKLGAILIEFAFAIPVLSGAVFFMTDAPRYYYIKSKMRSSVHFAANLFQNVSQFKKDKKITRDDLSRIFCASFANHYGGARPSEYYFSAYVYYVECYDNSGTANVIWAWHSKDVSINSNGPADKGEFLKANHLDSMVKYSATTPGSIYKSGNDTLIMVEGDAKIIVELALVPKNVSAKDDDSKKRFGFLMMPIRPTIGDSYFNTVTIITPKPGLFDEVEPAFEELLDS